MMIGLEANAGLGFDQFPGTLAGRYGVSLETVEDCREATEELHRALSVLFGTGFYWEELSLTAHFANREGAIEDSITEDDEDEG